MSDALPPASDWPAFARQVVSYAASRGDVERAQPPTDSDQPHSGAFVTLKKSGRLRGCMGTLQPARTLAETVRYAAVSAALHDPRFPPVAPGELSALTIEVSILSEPVPMRSLDDLQLGTHGIIVQRGSQRGLFLPQVATEHRLDKIAFLSRCCSEKAGLAPDAWQDPDTEVLLFRASIHREV